MFVLLGVVCECKTRIVCVCVCVCVCAVCRISVPSVALACSPLHAVPDRAVVVVGLGVVEEVGGRDRGLLAVKLGDDIT